MERKKKKEQGVTNTISADWEMQSSERIRNVTLLRSSVNELSTGLKGEYSLYFSMFVFYPLKFNTYWIILEFTSVRLSAGFINTDLVATHQVSSWDNLIVHCLSFSMNAYEYL